MTETTQERPFYEQARAERVSHPPASRLPVYLICGAAFVVGIIAFFVGDMSDGGRPSDLGRNIAYMLGYKFGGQLVYAAIIGGAATAFLSVTDGRRFRQRTAGEDFLWPFLSAIGGGLAAMALIVAIAAPAAAADAKARPIRDAHVALMDQDAADFDREVGVHSAHGTMLSGANLSRDPGYRKASARVAKLRELVETYHARQNGRFEATRLKLAATITDTTQRKRILAAFDAEVARAKPLLDRYWSLQSDSTDHLDAMITLVRTSPGVWEGDNYYFRRQADLDRFQARADEGARLKADVEETVRQLRALVASGRPDERRSL